MTPYHNHAAYPDTPIVERVELVRVEFKRGTGCCEESPIRRVTAYYNFDGTHLFEHDPAPSGAGGATE